jgi:hypothetical protein
MSRRNLFRALSLGARFLLKDDGLKQDVRKFLSKDLESFVSQDLRKSLLQDMRKFSSISAAAEKGYLLKDKDFEAENIEEEDFEVQNTEVQNTEVQSIKSQNIKSLNTKSSNTKAKLSVEYVAKKMGDKLRKISDADLVFIGDYHKDINLKVFASSLIRNLVNDGFEFLFIEINENIQDQVDEALKLFQKGFIDFKTFYPKASGSEDGKSWLHIKENPILIATMMAIAQKNNMKVVCVDNDPENKSPNVRFNEMKFRNQNWIKHIKENKIGSGKKGILFGGAYHIDCVNKFSIYESCEQAQGVDEMAKELEITVESITTREPDLTLGEFYCPRGEDLLILEPDEYNDYYFVSLPKISEKEMVESLFSAAKETNISFAELEENLLDKNLLGRER